MRISAAQRRARLGRRHLLAPGARAARTEEVAEALVGLHATDPATVVLSAWARLARPSLADVERALYEERTLLRMHCMRRTLFAVPTHLVPALHASTTVDVAARERAGLLRLLTAENPDWDAAWLGLAEEAALEALERLGGAGANEIAAEVPLLRETITLSRGKPYEARQRVGGWVLRLLAMEGRARRGRPRGGWTSGQFRYHAADRPEPVPAERARAEVVRHWLRGYGPGTTEDLRWWTGWTVRNVRSALADAGADPVELAEGVGWLLPEDREGAAEEAPPDDWAALLPGLDPSTMGWKHRDWYLDPEHRLRLFDTSGNAGPTVWRNGEIIGGWGCRPDGEVVWRLLADRGGAAREAVATEAGRLTRCLGEARFAPSFPTPLAAELSRGEHRS